MKTSTSQNFFKFPLFAGLMVLALAVTPRLRADSRGDSDQLEAKATLQPTAAAPAGAKGKVELKAKDSGGQTKALLKIETEGLAPATYTVSVVTKSDSTTVILGSLVVTGSTPAVTGTDSEEDDEPRDSHAQREKDRKSSVVFGSAAQPFPAGFDPFDIATLTVSDPTLVAMLVGDFSMAQSLLKISQTVTPGAAAPNAQGKLTIAARRKNGAEKSVITLFVKKVPANLPFTVNVNGTDVAQGVSTKNGMIRLGQTPGNPKGFAPFGQGISAFDLQSVILTDSNNEVIFSVTP